MPKAPSQSRRIITRVVTPFNRATVVARGRTRHLEVDGATYASFHPTRRFFGYAWDALAAAALYHPKAAHGGRGMHILLIGLGGGTALHGLNILVPHASITTAEIDAQLVDITRDHFDLKATGARVVVGDGYAHAEGAGPIYDLILDDAFLASGEAARTQAVSPVLLDRMTRGLRAGGMLACNVFTDSAHAKARLAARAVFAARYPATVELVPPKGHNAILCGLPVARPLAEVRAHINALPTGAKNAMLKVRAMVGGEWPASTTAQ